MTIEATILKAVKKSLQREDIFSKYNKLYIPDYSFAKYISISEHTIKADGMAKKVSNYQSEKYKGEIKVGKEGYYKLDFWFSTKIEHSTVSSAKVYCETGKEYEINKIINLSLTTEREGTNIGWGPESYHREMIINHYRKISELVIFYNKQGVKSKLLDEMIEEVIKIRKKIPEGKVDLHW
jgi:hypothetical protein